MSSSWFLCRGYLYRKYCSKFRIFVGRLLTRWTANIWFLPVERSRGHFEAPTISTIKCDVAEQISLMVGENVRWKRSLNVLCYPSAMNQDGFLPSIHFGDSLIAIRDRCRVISNSLSRKSLKLRHMIKERRVWDTFLISNTLSTVSTGPSIGHSQYTERMSKRL